MVPGLVVAVACFAAGGGFLFGLNVGVIAGALPSLRHDPDMTLTDSELELAVGGLKIGAAIGALAGTVLLRHCRRAVMATGSMMPAGRL